MAHNHGRHGCAFWTSTEPGDAAITVMDQPIEGARRPSMGWYARQATRVVRYRMTVSVGNGGALGGGTR
jgi:hypothetical protein